MTYDIVRTVECWGVGGRLRSRPSRSRTQTRPTCEQGKNVWLATKDCKMAREAAEASSVKMERFSLRCKAGNDLPGGSGLV